MLVTLSSYCLLVTSLVKIHGFISWCSETELRFLLCGLPVNYLVRTPNFIRSMQPLKCEKSPDGFNLSFVYKHWISSWNGFCVSVLFTRLCRTRITWSVLNCFLVRSSSLTKTGWMLSLSYNSAVWHHVSRVKLLIFHSTSKYSDIHSTHWLPVV